MAEWARGGRVGLTAVCRGPGAVAGTRHDGEPRDHGGPGGEHAVLHGSLQREVARVEHARNAQRALVVRIRLQGPCRGTGEGTGIRSGGGLPLLYKQRRRASQRALPGRGGKKC